MYIFIYLYIKRGSRSYVWTLLTFLFAIRTVLKLYRKVCSYFVFEHNILNSTIVRIVQKIIKFLIIVKYTKSNAHKET